MRVHFEDTLKQTEAVDITSPDGFYVAMYMSLWYGCLYILIEGWRTLRLENQEIDALLRSSNVNLLRIYRNATFHYQKDYLHEKFMTFLREGEATATASRPQPRQPRPRSAGRRGAAARGGRRRACWRASPPAGPLRDPRAAAASAR